MSSSSSSAPPSESTLRRAAADFSTAFLYVYHDAKRRKCHCCLGFLAVFIVVTFVALLQASIARSPIIFMKLAEDEVGDYDLMIAPDPSIYGGDSTAEAGGGGGVNEDLLAEADAGGGGGGGGGLFGLGGGGASAGATSSLAAFSPASFTLNYTDIDAKLRGTPLITGASPRWLMLAKLLNARAPAANGSAIVLVIDSTREAALNIGRGWTHRALGANETHVSAVLLRRLRIEPNAGAQLTLRIDLLDLLSQFSGSAGGGLGGFGGGGGDSGGGGGGGGGDSGLINSLLGSVLPAGVDYARFANLTLRDVIDEAAAAAAGVARGNATAAEEALVWQWVNGTLDYLHEQLPWLVPPLADVDFDATLGGALAAALGALGRLERNYTVIDAIESPGGKFAKALGNVAVLEAAEVHALLAAQLNAVARALAPLTDERGAGARALLDAALRVSDAELLLALRDVQRSVRALERFDLYEHALSIVCVYRDRLATYTAGRDEIVRAMVQLTNAVMDALGYRAAVSLSTAVADAMTSLLYFIKLFLDQIFTFTTIVLVGLSAMLIYSLMLTDVEEKTYEYGMLRAQGMRQYVLVELLLIQSLFFSVPGIALGLLAAFALYVPLAVIVHYFVFVPIDVRMAPSAIITAVVIGLLVPAISNVAPIRRALARTLREALDLFHMTASETTVQIIKLERIGLSPWQVVVSVLMIFFGFVVYYMIPYAFTYSNFALFLLLLTIILLGMLIGLALISQVLGPLMERGALELMMWRGDRRHLKGVVAKNLFAHAARNRKTATMFTVMLAFIIFVGTSMALQGTSIKDNIEVGLGADVVVLSFQLANALDEPAMRAYLDGELARQAAGDADAYVLGYSFETFALDALPAVRSTYLSNLAGYPSTRVRLIALDHNFLDVGYLKFFLPDSQAAGLTFNATRNGRPDFIASLYGNRGKMRLPIEADGIVVPPDLASRMAPYDYDASGDGGGGGNASSDGGQTTTTPPPPDDDDDGDDGPIAVRINEDAYKNYIDVIMSEALNLAGSVDTSTPMYLRTSYDGPDGVESRHYALAKAHGMLHKLPGQLTLSSYRQLAWRSPLITNVLAYESLMRRIANETLASGVDERMRPYASPTARAPKSKLYVHTTAAATERDRESIINGLRNFIRDDITQVLDTGALVGTTKTAIDLLTYFFVVVTIIAIILCFFVLWLSFTANINEHSWELSVLRALGLTTNQVIRCFVYEALALVLSSVLLGTTVGVLLALTLTLQFNLFTELPFSFQFQYETFIFLVCLSVLCAIAGSFFPARSILRVQIASGLKAQ